MQRNGFGIVAAVVAAAGLWAWFAGGADSGPEAGRVQTPAPSAAVSSDPEPSPEPYQGLSEEEKQAIWRNELPLWSFEDREKARKGIEGE
jgi:hypothetical protein